jgi:tetratricopeptide (TPR) repeat protein
MKKVMTIPHEAEYFYRLAVDTQHKEHPEKVIEYFDQAIAAHPENAIAWNEKANFLDYLGKCDEALQCYDAALRIDPESSEAWFNKGLTLKRLGRENEAIACINRGIEYACGR